MFTKVLLAATYEHGKPGRPTEAHKNAEHHRFKKDFLFKKNKPIPREIYASRLIQHLLIIKAIEAQLKTLAEKNEPQLDAFFALSYLDQLLRTSAMETDLRLLDINPEAIQKKQIAPTTALYLGKIETLPPKKLLAHFLLHVVGFMHGGAIIRSMYIEPSNKSTVKQIPANQYDFSAAVSKRETSSVMTLYADMMEQVDKISLDEQEYSDIFAECNGIYETMTKIYDDLCIMHTKQPKLTISSLAMLSASLFALGFIVNVASAYITFDTNASRPA